jgi:hypothetical protein
MTEVIINNATDKITTANSVILTTNTKQEILETTEPVVLEQATDTITVNNSTKITLEVSNG